MQRKINIFKIYKKYSSMYKLNVFFCRQFNILSLEKRIKIHKIKPNDEKDEIL